MTNKFRDKKNASNTVHTWLAVIQTAIAILMLWTLIQNGKVLEITQRQLESTIEPVIIPRMYGPTIRLSNTGSIEISNITTTALIFCWFDFNTGKIDKYHSGPRNVIIKDTLSPNQYLEIDVRKHILSDTVEPSSQNSSMKIYGLIITYRRKADMKPFHIFLPFMQLENKENAEENSFIPLLSSLGSVETGPMHKPSSRILEMARSELLSIYENKIAPININQ